MTWRGLPEPAPSFAFGAAGWLRIGLRGLLIAMVLMTGLTQMLLLRVIERPLFGQRRPWTPLTTVTVCRMVLAILGFRRTVLGRPMQGGGAVVANHTSWLDIFALNATQRVCFVAKAEVRGWPGIGWLARATGTVFIRRDRRQAAAQARLLAARLAAGQRLLLFPEGTSSDGRRVLPFRSTLFAAFEGLNGGLPVQPVSVIWHPPPGGLPGYYGWWGDMDFAPNLLKVLATPRQGLLELRYHPPLAAGADRKALARRLEQAVRDGQVLAEGRSA